MACYERMGRLRSEKTMIKHWLVWVMPPNPPRSRHVASYVPFPVKILPFVELMPLHRYMSEIHV